VSVSAIGRAVGPYVAGGAFTEGLEMGYMILPWWILAFFAILGHVATWWLVEMDGIQTQKADDGDADAAEMEELASLLADDDEDEIDSSSAEELIGQEIEVDPELALDSDDERRKGRRSTEFGEEVGKTTGLMAPKATTRMRSPAGKRDSS